jgi:glycosyltransferase involved in cell wall biosynthesis
VRNVAAKSLDVAVVASWYPAIDDQVRGRFIADQVRALAASGRVRPIVVSFDPAGLVGDWRLRTRLADRITVDAIQAIGGPEPIFSAKAYAADAPIPVARLPISGGRTASQPVLHALRFREAVLDALATRWIAGGDRGEGKAPASWPPRPALIHAHTGYPDGAAAVSLADRLDVPLIITEHASYLGSLLARPEIRAAYLRGAQRAGRLLAVSQALAAELRAALPEVADRIEVLPNAVAADDFQTIEGGAIGGEDRRPGELLYIGHRTDGKGMATLLQAFALIRAARPTTSLRLIGGAPDPALERRWRRLADDLGLAAAVSFEPPADRRSVAAAMARAGVFVHASRRETFGVVIAEALAAGLPVVATASEGATEILGSEVARFGALVPPDDPAAFAAAVVDVIDRRDQFDRAALRASVRARFDAPLIAARLADVYGDVLADDAGQRGPAPRPGMRGGLDHEPTAQPIRGSAALPPANRLRVLVALDPERARLADALPEAARAGLIVVTAAGPGGPVARYADVITADLGGRSRVTADVALLGRGPLTWRRLGRLVRHPAAAARRRGWLPGLEQMVRTRGEAAVALAIARARSSGRDPAELPTIVCTDGLDHLAASPAIDRGEATAAPGGLRWLADRSA